MRNERVCRRVRQSSPASPTARASTPTAACGTPSTAARASSVTRRDGRIDRVVELPVSNVTCCCFGGKDFDTLYISTARQRMTPEQLAREPLAGNIFACRPGVRGLPEARYADN